MSPIQNVFLRCKNQSNIQKIIVLGRSRSAVVSMENNTIVNNNTRINFCLLATINLLLPLPVPTHYRFTNIFSHLRVVFELS